ncbi:hypothetical protein Vretimale_18283 [Volvox reticuliferus]|uniref:Uncharacterized protein n=2 Tax=Volvox reticuliferus TaxID=1737510 RepID=A0A8J4GWV4_9CHLO|nr:hypothetical protein Vretimale_18283 [Volvox reticuliferus]
MDSSLLVWSLRIRETEALLQSRQQERDGQAARRQALQDQLHERKAEQSRAEQRELRARERLARSQHAVQRHLEEMKKLQTQADCGDKLLRSTKRSLESRREQLKATAEVEEHRCTAFDAQVSERRQELVEPVLKLEATLAKVQQRLSYARQTYDMASLTSQLDAQRDRREALQAEVDRKRTALEGLSKEVADVQGQLEQRERINVAAVERSQAALREARSSLDHHLHRRADARQRLQDARGRRVAAASRLADLQQASEAARQTLSCLLDENPQQQQP